MSDVMREEILQQPGACAGLLERESRNLRPFVRSLAARPPVAVVIAARGSSDHAAVYARYLLEAVTGLPVALAAPSLLTVYKARPRLKNTLVIGVSQSGQGPDICAVVREAARQGAATLALTNDPSSPLARASRQVIALGAGTEQAVAATKTYTTEVAGLALLGALWSGKPALLKQLMALPPLMARVLEMTREGAEATAAGLKRLNDCVVLGRGFQLGTAHEMALKMKECAGVPALSYSTADFQHGPVSLARNGYPVFLVAAPGAMSADSDFTVKDMLQRGASVHRVGLRESGSSGRSSGPRFSQAMTARLAGCPEVFSPLLTILPGQWFAYFLALAKGKNPAKPVGLKKVTKTK